MFFDPLVVGAVIFRKEKHSTLYTSFEAHCSSETEVRSYPEWAIEIPNQMFCNQSFRSETANLLCSRDESSCNHGLLTSVLRDVGRNTVTPRIVKRVHAYYPSKDNRLPLWLLIKIAIQTSLDHDDRWRMCYKAFMLYFMCSLAKDAIGAHLSDGILHAISAKILRRLKKFGSSAPDCLSDFVFKTIASLRQTLEVGWKVEEATHPTLPSWRPSELDISGDMQLSLSSSREHISNSLRDLGLNPLCVPFCPEPLPRGALNDYLFSTLFDEAYRLDPYLTLYDVEQAIEGGIDDWIIGVTNEDQAYLQLEILMIKYLSRASHTYNDDPENLSIMLLTAIELWVALDKLVVSAVPMLTDYSPEVSTQLLPRLVFRKIMNIHRLRCAYQYISARHSQSLPDHFTSSGKFAIDTFTPRYCGNILDIAHSPDSLDLRHLSEEYGPSMSKSLHADIVVFELQHPVPLYVWHSVTHRLLKYIQSNLGSCAVTLANICGVRPELTKYWKSPFTDRVYLVGFIPWGSHDISEHYETRSLCEENIAYDLPLLDGRLKEYVRGTSHVSNDVLVAQANCSNGLTPSEFIAFGHLRSGGSLQWLNILQELRSRTLNFRRRDVHLLLAQATSEVGALDQNSVEWVWHQELQESSFCAALLDALESLLVDVASCSLDGVIMSSISFLLTRLLASSCCEETLERAIGLLREVRAKTFHWVQELSYDLMIAPANTERSNLLRDMAATCRSTFDVGPAVVGGLPHTVEDVDALLSCAIFIHVKNTIEHPDRTSDSCT